MTAKTTLKTAQDDVYPLTTDGIVKQFERGVRHRFKPWNRPPSHHKFSGKAFSHPISYMTIYA